MARTATATVLVTDVVASTALRVALGEERADQLRRELDAASSEAVAAHGGNVIKGLGDGLLALFPGAAEAVAAGVALQQAAAELAAQDGSAALELIFGSLMTEPKRVGKPLVGELAGLWSARRGDYRVVYEIDDEESIVLIHRVPHRRSVYRPR